LVVPFFYITLASSKNNAMRFQKYHESYGRTPIQLIGDSYYMIPESVEESNSQKSPSKQDLFNVMRVIGNGELTKYYGYDDFLKYVEDIGDKTIVIYGKIIKNPYGLTSRNKVFKFILTVYEGATQTTQCGGGYGSSGIIMEHRTVIGSTEYVITWDFNAISEMTKKVRNLLVN
jgi:hypothetical protein